MKRSSFLKSIATILIAPSVIKEFGGIDVPLSKKLVPIKDLRLGEIVTVNGVNCLVNSVTFYGQEKTFTARPLTMDKDAGNGYGMGIRFKLTDL